MATRVRAVAAAALLVACGGGKPSARVEMSDCGGLFAVSDDGSAWAYVDGDALIVMAGGHRTTLGSGLGCSLREASTLFVGPGGKTVALWGTRLDHADDLWGHAGRHVGAACVIDVATADVHALPQDLGDDSERVAITAVGRRILMWHRDNASELIVADGERGARLALPGGRCAIAPIGDDVIEAVCDMYRALVVRRYRLDTGALDGADVSLPRREVGNGGGIALTPDGRFFAYWGSAPAAAHPYDDSPMRGRVVVLDLSRGIEASSYDRIERGDLIDVALDPGGTGDLLMSKTSGAGFGDDGEAPRAIVRRVTPAGKVVLERRLRDSTLFWTERDGFWTAGPCGAEHVAM